MRSSSGFIHLIQQAILGGGWVDDPYISINSSTPCPPLLRATTEAGRRLAQLRFNLWLGLEDLPNCQAIS
jgi:hypothetical protein